MYTIAGTGVTDELDEVNIPHIGLGVIMTSLCIIVETIASDGFVLNGQLEKLSRY